MRPTRRTVALAAVAMALPSAVAVIAQAQDATGVIGEAWRVGGPIAAVVTAMLIASSIAIRTLWMQLQTERAELKQALDQRNNDTAAFVREMRDCINGNTSALNRLADRLDDNARGQPR